MLKKKVKKNLIGFEILIQNTNNADVARHPVQSGITNDISRETKIKPAHIFASPAHFFFLIRTNGDLMGLP